MNALGSTGSAPDVTETMESIERLLAKFAPRMMKAGGGSLSRAGRAPISGDVKQAIRDRLSAGENPSTVARSLGVSGGTVRRYSQPPQKCRRVTPEIAAEILAGINANETTAEIATRLGVSVAAVRKVANTPVPAIH